MSITKRMAKHLNENYGINESCKLEEHDGIPIYWDSVRGVAYIYTKEGRRIDFPDEDEAIEYIDGLNESYKRRGKKINESFDKNEIYQDYFCQAFINEYTSEVAMSFRYVLDDAEKGKIFIEEYPEIINDLKAYGLSFSGDKEIACLYKVAKRFGLVI